MQPFEKGDRTRGRKVLVAAEDSEFKRQVVEEVIGTLGTEDWYFRVIGLDQLAEHSTDGYGAVLLVCKLTGGRVEQRARAFLQENSTKSKTILLLTLAGEGPLPEAAKADITVDAVTSASSTDLVRERAAEVAAQLQRRF